MRSNIYNDPTKEVLDHEFEAFDKDPNRNPYFNEDDEQGRYDNADQIEAAFKAGYRAGYERGFENA